LSIILLCQSLQVCPIILLFQSSRFVNPCRFDKAKYQESSKNQSIIKIRLSKPLILAGLTKPNTNKVQKIDLIVKKALKKKPIAKPERIDNG